MDDAQECTKCHKRKPLAEFNTGVRPPLDTSDFCFECRAAMAEEEKRAARILHIKHKSQRKGTWKNKKPERRKPLQIKDSKGRTVRGRDVKSEFCSECDRPTDKKNAVLGDWADFEKCKHEDCPLKPADMPEDPENYSKMNINGKITYAPKGVGMTSGKAKKASRGRKQKRNRGNKAMFRQSEPPFIKGDGFVIVSASKKRRSEIAKKNKAWVKEQKEKAEALAKELEAKVVPKDSESTKSTE